MASLFVSLALTPLFLTVGRRGISKEKAAKVASEEITSEFKLVKWMGENYSKALPHALKHRKIVLLSDMFLFIFSMFVFLFMGKEFMPKVDQREFSMKVNLMTGTRLEITNSAVKKIEENLLNSKDVDSVAVTIGSSKETGSGGDMIETLGSHQANIIVNLKKQMKRKMKNVN